MARSGWDRGRKIDLFHAKKLFLANAALAEFHGNRLPNFVSCNGDEERPGLLRKQKGTRGDGDREKADWKCVAEEAPLRIRASLQRCRKSRVFGSPFSG